MVILNNLMDIIHSLLFVSLPSYQAAFSINNKNSKNCCEFILKITPTNLDVWGKRKVVTNIKVVLSSNKATTIEDLDLTIKEQQSNNNRSNNNN